jgi:NADP-reducing hydrogenase subunit HndD
MGMLSSLIRHYWWPKQPTAGSDGDQSKLFVVSVMPCTAKKDEMSRKQLGLDNGRGQETDAVLTVREMARLMELRGVAERDNLQSFYDIPEQPYDNPLGESTGAAILFGATGGVMEAALRTAADVLSGQDLKEVKYEQVRGLEGIKESTVQLGKDRDISVNVAVANQMRNVREFVDQIKEGKKDYRTLFLSVGGDIIIFTYEYILTTFESICVSFFVLKTLWRS